MLGIRRDEEINSVDGEIRTHKHEGLSFVALPIRLTSTRCARSDSNGHTRCFKHRSFTS
jgi:hypothetical protein